MIVFTLIIMGACQEPVIPDFEPPEIVIVRPEDGENIYIINDVTPPREVVISAEVTDNEGVASVQCHANYHLLGEKRDPPYSWIWLAGNEGAGHRRIQIVAKDVAGNERSTAIQVNILLAQSDFLDGSFEEQTTTVIEHPWYTGTETRTEPNDTEATVELGTGKAYHGTNCAKLITDSRDNWISIYQELNLEPNTEYEFKCWVNAEPVSETSTLGRIMLQAQDAQWDGIDYALFNIADISGWTEIVLGFTPPGTNPTVYLSIGTGVGAAVTLRIDAFSLRKK